MVTLVYDITDNVGGFGFDFQAGETGPGVATFAAFLRSLCRSGAKPLR